MFGEEPLFGDDSRGATMSPCGRYRYDLWRRWDDGPRMGWVMCNPSVADAFVDDQTIGRCIGFAKREGLAGIVVRNVFAYRTPYPKDLVAAARAGVDIVGPENDAWLWRLAENQGVATIVAAWGALSLVRKRIPVLEKMFDGLLSRLDIPGREAGHPLYVAGSTLLTPYGVQRSP